MNIKHKMGFILLFLASLCPIWNGWRILKYAELFMTQFLLGLGETQLAFFSFFTFVGPLSLILTGFCALYNIWFIINRKKRFAVWLQLLTVVVVGVGDSLAAAVFYSKAPPQPLMPIFLPVVVTTLSLMGIALVFDYAIEK